MLYNAWMSLTFSLNQNKTRRGVLWGPRMDNQFGLRPYRGSSVRSDRCTYSRLHNEPYHKRKKVVEAVGKMNQKITLGHLTAYSPDLIIWNVHNVR